MNDATRPLYIPVILGTTRHARMSEHAARFVAAEVAKREGIESELIDIRELNLPFSGESTDVKDPGFSEKMMRSDALIIVGPEYNHGYAGSLKHALDTCLKEYIHKAVGVCGVSAGVFGGTRMVENLLPVLRELGLVTIFWDVNFGNVNKVFDGNGTLLDGAYVERVDKFLKELVWMARVLRYGRENVTLQ